MRRCRPLLGTRVEVTADEPAAIDAAFAAVEHIHALMSAHEPDSELSRINRCAHLQPVAISEPTRAVLQRALHWWRESRGVFDVARAGELALASGRLPRHPGQPVPKASDLRVLSLEGNEVRLDAPACLDLGGIAKGFAVDRAVRAMRRAGARAGLVNAGGDLFGFGPKPWPVQVVDPVSRRALVEVPLANQALATSALHADGSGAHLLLGYRQDRVSVTVRAGSACEADALTKVVWQGPAAAALLERAGAMAFAIHRDGTVEAVDGEAIAA